MNWTHTALFSTRHKLTIKKYKLKNGKSYVFFLGGEVANSSQESPHEHQQNLLLSRIINNVVCHLATFSLILVNSSQEKLNEAIMLLNKSLQVG